MIESALSIDEAIALVATGIVLLDVRENSEWAAGHSPRAIGIPMSQLNERLSELPDDRDILVVCRSGSRSERVTTALREIGYPAANVLGGMAAWHRAGEPLVSETGAPALIV